jgi:hypothetical protein
MVRNHDWFHDYVHFLHTMVLEVNKKPVIYISFLEKWHFNEGSFTSMKAYGKTKQKGNEPSGVSENFQ